MDTLNTILLVVGTVGGSSVLTAVVTQWFLKRKTEAEAHKIHKDSSIDAYNKAIEDVLQVNQRIQERMVDLEKRVAGLEKENYELKSDKLKSEQIIWELREKLKLHGSEK